MKKHFITFADSKYQRSKDRIVTEAETSGFFDTVQAFGDESLPSEIVQYCIENTRGYGFWIWKSYIIREYLKKLDFGDIVIYCDIGCIVNKYGANRYREYLNILENEDMVVFQTPHLERHYTKADTFIELNAIDFINSGQIAATGFLMKKTHTTLNVIDEWYDYCHTKRNLLDDSESEIKNDGEYIDNRHDQSIFSLICKKYGVYMLNNEIWMAKDDLGTIFDMDYPFHGARLKY